MGRILKESMDAEKAPFPAEKSAFQLKSCLFIVQTFF